MHNADDLSVSLLNLVNQYLSGAFARRTCSYRENIISAAFHAAQRDPSLCTRRRVPTLKGACPYASGQRIVTRERRCHQEINPSDPKTTVSLRGDGVCSGTTR